MTATITDSPDGARPRFHTASGPRRRVRVDEIAVGDVLPRRGEVIAVFASLAPARPDMRLLVLRLPNGGIEAPRYASGSTLEVIKKQADS